MRRHLSWAAVLLLPGACATATYVYQTDVIGPHGEHLVELACDTPDACMALGRQVCQGNFDIVNSGRGTNSAVSGTYTGGSNLVLIQCQSGPPSFATPAAPPPQPAPQVVRQLDNGEVIIRVDAGTN